MDGRCNIMDVRIYVERLPKETFLSDWALEKKHDNPGSVVLWVIDSWNELGFVVIV